jgi:hypothetical protein
MGIWGVYCIRGKGRVGNAPSVVTQSFSRGYPLLLPVVVIAAAIPLSVADVVGK